MELLAHVFLGAGRLHLEHLPNPEQGSQYDPGSIAATLRDKYVEEPIFIQDMPFLQPISNQPKADRRAG